MPNRIIIIVLLLATALFGSVVAVIAAPVTYSGVLELRYGAHSATESGNKVLDASHFTQKYSFLAQKKGLLSNGRLGKYDLALGYEWSWVDAQRDKGVDVVIANPLDKLLYRGAITLAPGGLPFNLHAFSYDMYSTQFVKEELGELFKGRGDLDDGGTITDILNGTHRVTGLTLEAGVHNGRYGGAYRDVLSTLPRLLIDYRQNDVRDLKTINPRNYTDRDLAFISLNKKDNWFHYKVFTHEDRIDPTTNYRSQTFLLGNIDHHERRRWVNLTNWIKVSADISYSETLPSSSTTTNNVQFQKRYDVNFFAKAQRARWQGSSFTSFSRSVDGDSLDRSFSLPFYANGELNRNTAWRARLIGTRTESDLFSGGMDRQTDDLYATSRVDTFRQSRYIVTPEIAAEAKQGLDGEGYAVKAGLEFRNNSGIRSDYDLFGRYLARWFTGTGQIGRNVDYLEQQISGKIEKDLTSRLRGGVEQSFLVADGAYDSTVADNITADSDAIINYAPNGDGTVFRSLTTFSADYRSLSRLNNRVELIFDYQTSPALSGLQTQLTHRMDYRSGAWLLTVENKLGFGDELATTSINLGRGVENFFTNTSRIRYRPTRAIKADLEVGYEQRTYATGFDTERYRALESADYTLWNINGLIRKLAVFGQKIELAKILQNSQTAGDDYTAFTLFAHYYPTRISLFSAELRYDLDNAVSNGTLIAYLSAGLNFRKLKFSLDYSYGDRSAGDSELARTEQRWEVKVKKLF